MNYPVDVESRLGFDQIRQKLTSYCLAQPGIRLVEAMQFQVDAEVIAELLHQNHEFRQIIDKGENFPSSHFIDPDEIFKKISLEGNYLDESEFLSLAYSIQTLLACRDFLSNAKDIYPVLFRLTTPVTLSKNLGTRQTVLLEVDSGG
jgi:DNA mismatch repair protein MutS2